MGGVPGLWPDAAAEADRAVRGPLERTVTSPRQQLVADREQVLSRALPSGFLPVTRAGIRLEVPVDSGAELAHQMGALSAAQEQVAAPASRREIPLPAEELKGVSTPRVRKRRPKRRPRRPGSLEQREEERAKLGVKLAAHILINEEDVTLATDRRLDEIDFVVGDPLDRDTHAEHRLPPAPTVVDPDLADALPLPSNKTNPLGLNWLHGAGLSLGANVKPRFLGPQRFNASAQARSEWVVRRLKGSYLSAGHRIVVNARQDGFLDAFLLNMLGDVKEPKPSTPTILLPTPGMSIESWLGKSTGCEEHIERSRAIEVRRLFAVADQAELEADRLRARLGSLLPLLEGPQELAP
jgi:hypothetical protein